MIAEDHSSRLNEFKEGLREHKDKIRVRIEEIDKKVRIQSRKSSREQLHQPNNALSKYRRQIAATAGASSSNNDQSVSKINSEESLLSPPRQTQEYIEKLVNQKLANILKGQEALNSPYGLNATTQETFKLNYDKSREKFMNASFYMKGRDGNNDPQKNSREGTKSADTTKLVKRIKPQTAESAQNMQT